ncbi:CDP-glucose 4,6-dehydratase [Propionivibrio dicarboxylicus]|uniref:CDP-glucose 4,6-dehydratase n=1 Tax=Propionivibrio dicarboxylicus TaxID=83767 RepID=A0A1G8DYE2_9RHOO|nr:CDP-glucose 4,6-dehydratase [Propionivibrio dicarboxylicus]SDH62598.1 CDP-glucose 4,6-dehydratase [Propionivibrio dicarboxylicus]
MNRQFWQGKKVFITGHTGFKGSWLALWLADMGAEVHGYAMLPPTSPALNSVAAVPSHIADSVVGDVREGQQLAAALLKASPEIVFHLAAQALVRESYAAPAETYATNVMGTVNLLEAVRQCPGVKAVVNVTTDKCYENREWLWSYREHDALGGYDPYSSSKACSELVTAAYRNSFLRGHGVQVATARAGNVIGGGDWAKDRLLPDFLRALDAGHELVIRSPRATRPWQHVLEPLSGYLCLAEQLFLHGESAAGAWNFGPADADTRPVGWIVEYLCSRIAGSAWRCEDASVHEATSLKLDSAKARAHLNWVPRWNIATALDMTIEWHKAWKRGEDMKAYSLSQIHQYEASSAQP